MYLRRPFAGVKPNAAIAVVLLSAAGSLLTAQARAQSAEPPKPANQIPEVVVETTAPTKPKSEPAPKKAPAPGASSNDGPPAKKKSAAPASPPVSIPAETIADTGEGAQGPTGSPANRSGSLTVPNTAEATAEINRTPGGVDVVPDTAIKNTPANTIKDALRSVPGVTIQTRWGPDARVSIRGSGLTRSFGNRGLNLYMDGIAINTSDGLFDLFEIDPAAYRYIEVYKGANAMRYGSNSLGGALNFVTPTGRDASPFEARVDVGSFGYVRSSISSGAAFGPWDYFINLSAQGEDGYRDHNENDVERLNANLGYRFSPNAETRFYVNLNRWRAEIPGEVTEDAALNQPKNAAAAFVLQDQQRNIDSLRVANKTTLRFDQTVLEFGASTHQRHVDHPIFEYLDFTVEDYGGFARVTDDRFIGGFRNRLIAGVNILNGMLDYEQYVNLPGAVKGPLTFSSADKSENFSAYVENSFSILRDLALIAGVQYQRTVRDRQDRFFNDNAVNPFDFNADDSGRSEYNIWSPKFGVLWDVAPNWQIFGNVSRSAEVPTFDVNSFSSPESSNVKAQRATTYEIGTRGVTPDFNWDLSLYRAEIDDELQCLTTGLFGFCTTVNADETVHQGIEAGFNLAFAKSVLDLDDRFWLNVTYTYNDFFFDGDMRYGDNTLPGVAPHNILAELLYKHPSGFYVGPNVEWIPEGMYADNANALKLDPYSLLNFRAGFDQPVGWSGYVEGRNLLDKHYVSSTVTIGDGNPIFVPFLGRSELPLFGELFNPGTGTAVYAGARYKW